MSTSHPPEFDPDDVANLEQRLRESLVTQPWEAAVHSRVKASVEREWQVSTEIARDRRRRARHQRAIGFAVAAGLAIVALMVIAGRPSNMGTAIGTVTRISDGGLDERTGFFRHRALAIGEAVRVGNRLSTQGSALVSLAHGGTLRIAGGSALVVSAASLLTLEHGLIYVDIPPALSGTLRVATRAGVVEHVGTEFEVLSDARAVRIRVREGSILFISPAQTLLAEAGTEVFATPGGRIVHESVATFGREWMWTEALAPDYDIEGHSLIEFLRWASRELGRSLDFADPRAQEVARHTILHGSVKGEAPLDALTQVLATTSLSHEVADGSIRVHSGP